MTSPQTLDDLASQATPAAPAAEAPPTARAQAVAKLEMLDGDELIQLSIKPSLWFIPMVSARVILVVVAICIAMALAMQGGYTPTRVVPFQILAAIVAIRLGVAMLQWASRLYVLTNRRVMRFKGVLSVDVVECRLERIGQVCVQATWYARLLRLGSIAMTPAESKATHITWDDVSRPDEVHEILEKAIRKSKS